MLVGIFDIFDFRAVPIICYLLQLILYMGGLSIIINCFICYYVCLATYVYIYICVYVCTCVHMCLHVVACVLICVICVIYQLSIGDFVTVHVLCWSCTCIVVGTQCGFSPLCVANFICFEGFC